MKTRIKKIERCNGEIVYYCEKLDFEWGHFISMLPIPVIGWVICFFIIANRWRIIYRNNKKILSDPAYFKNYNDAVSFLKSFNNEIIIKKLKQKSIIEGMKIKKITIIKPQTYDTSI